MKQHVCLLWLLMCASLFSCGTTDSNNKPLDLLTEYQTDPLGIDVVNPRFSWLINDTNRGAMQTAYEIMVASDPKLLRKDQPDIWQTGKINSDQSYLVPYDGPALSSRQTCYWKVRTWGRNDQPSAWSDIARWEMGLLSEDDWEAGWIGLDLIAEQERLVRYGSWISHTGGAASGELFLRKSFDIPEGKTPRRAFLHSLGIKEFQLYFNGALITEGEYGGNMIAMPWQDRLENSSNLLAVKLSDHSGKECSLIYYMEIIYSDGSTGWIFSDENTKAAEQAPPDWYTMDYDDSEWTDAEVLAPFGGGERGWIESAGPAPRSTLIRKEFTADKRIERARAYVTGLGNYELYLNGRKVGNDLLTPGWTDYFKRVQYQVYDVTDQIKRGENAAGMWLGNMWWSSGLGWRGGIRYNKGPVRGLCQIEIRYTDGSTELIASDESWGAHTSPLLENTLYHGETYDARLEQEGWAMPGFDEDGWAAAVPLTDHGDLVMSAQFAPPIRIMDEIEPVSVTEVKPGVYVFDMGKNMVGMTRLKVSGERGTEIRLRFAELLHDDGTVAQENLRSAKSTDFYICRGEGEETWQQRFTYHGFRYVQVDGFPGVPEKDNLTGLQVYSSAEATGSFECSDELINSIHANINNGQRGNMHCVPTDCPQRDERLGWTGDAQMFAPTANYNMDMALFFSKWLRDITDSQAEEGYVHDVNPAIVVEGPGKPAWADAVTIVPWHVYRFYGDEKIISDNYPGMKAWVEYMIRNSENGLYIYDNGSGWHGYGDWISVVPSPGHTISAAYYYYSTRLLTEMAHLLGKADDFARYLDLAGEIRNRFNEEFYNNRTGNYPGATQTANLLPLAFGIVEEEYRQKVADNIAANVIERGKHPSTGFLGTGYLLPILSDYGYHELAWEVATQTSYPSWGYMVSKGATSIWELWNSDTEPPDRMNSRNHFALGSAGEWFYSHLAGIRPVTHNPGYKQSVIKPMPADGLNRVDASVKTGYGMLESHWERTGNGLKLDVHIPANTLSTIHIPVKGVSNPSLSESGIIIFSDGEPFFDVPEEMEVIDFSDEEILVSVLPGRYHFEVTPN